MSVQKLPARRPRNAAATREAIVAAATQRFARDGYEQVGVRDIAGDAGIDPALVNRYFGSKEGLFVAVLESLVARTPEQDELTPRAMAEGMARRILTWEGGPSRDQMLAIDIAVRSTSSPVAKEIVRADMQKRFVEPLAARMGGDADARARAQLMSAMMMGAGVMRSLLGERAGERPHLEEMIAYLGTILGDLADPKGEPRR